jgi:hypothetical protein
MKQTYDYVFERNLLRFVRINPKATYQKVCDTLDTTLANRTLCGILTKHSITSWRAKKRLFLQKEYVKRSQFWCLTSCDYDEAMWANYIFSDECSLERGSGRRRTWVFCTPTVTGQNGQA